MFVLTGAPLKDFVDQRCRNSFSWFYLIQLTRPVRVDKSKTHVKLPEKAFSSKLRFPNIIERFKYFWTVNGNSEGCL